MKWLPIVGVMLASAQARADDRVAVDGALEVGVLSTTHGKLTASYAHRFWDDRLYAEVRLGAGLAAGDLWMVEERAGLGVVFVPSKRVELRVGWRAGHTHFGGEIGTVPYGLNLLAIEVVVQVALRVSDAWSIRAIPLGPTVYWNRSYGASIGFELGVERAF